MLRKSGTMSASHEHAEEALAAGAPVLVYPGARERDAQAAIAAWAAATRAIGTR